MNKDLQKGIELFLGRNFSEALREFSLALENEESQGEARICIILCDMAMQNEVQATALFEYYLFIKESGQENCEKNMEELINAIDKNSEKIAHLFKDSDFEARINSENGVRYEDFTQLIESRGSFKEAFEDIMFSTKVIISKKEDFIDFLGKLYENGFTEITMNYLESAVSMFPNDEQLLTLIKKFQP